MIRDSYADYPRSVNELRTLRSGNAADWSPREILIAMLREIDAGRLEPESLVVVYREKREGGFWSDFSSSCADGAVMLGLLETAKQLMWRGRL